MTDIVERLRFRADENYEMLANIHEPLLEAADEIERLRAAFDRLYWYAERLKKRDPLLIEAADEIERLRSEVQTWISHTKTAVWSDSEECKFLTEENAKLRAALERVLDSGLLFGPTAMHDEIKAIAHAALGGEP